MTSIRFRYETIEFGKFDIHLRTLRDQQQFFDRDGIAEGMGISSTRWPLFGFVTPSAKVLAHHMHDYDIENKRILEVGCGIALASLVLNFRNADITATDLHPEVERFLLENIKLNQASIIPFEQTGWENKRDGLGQFDLVIGSDLLYENDHAELLSGFIDRHAMPHSEVIIVDPGRSQQERFSNNMSDLGYNCERREPMNTYYLEHPFTGYILHYRR